MLGQVKSLFRLSFATLLFVAQELIQGMSSAGRSKPSTASKSSESLGAFSATDMTAVDQGPQPLVQPPRAHDSGKLNTSSFVVLGGGLAAGMGDFSLSSDTQAFSFPAQLAKQMGVTLTQPLIEPPGIGEAVGFAPWSVIMPSALQATVLERPLKDPSSNLSVPGHTVSDAIRLRPHQPLINRTSGKQTTVNLMLGAAKIAQGVNNPLPSQLESAIALAPTFALVELGYTEALDAATSGSASR